MQAGSNMQTDLRMMRWRDYNTSRPLHLPQCPHSPPSPSAPPEAACPLWPASPAAACTVQSAERCAPAWGQMYLLLTHSQQYQYQGLLMSLPWLTQSSLYLCYLLEIEIWSEMMTCWSENRSSLWKSYGSGSGIFFDVWNSKGTELQTRHHYDLPTQRFRVGLVCDSTRYYEYTFTINLVHKN